MKITRIGPFKAGADNRREDISLWDREKGAALRSAVNVDITDLGKLRRRSGFAPAPGEVAPIDFPVSLPVTRTSDSSTTDILDNQPLRSTMNPQPRALSCKHFGRYVAAFGDTLFYSDPFLDGDEFGRGAQTTPDRNFLPFAAPITSVFSTGTGLYVSADATYFISGDVHGSAPNPSHPTQIVRGSVAEIPKENKYAWISTQGPAVGDQNGSVDLVAAERLETGPIPPTLTGASLFRSSNGLRQLVMTLHGQPSSSGAVSSDYMDAVVVRKDL